MLVGIHDPVFYFAACGVTRGNAEFTHLWTFFSIGFASVGGALLSLAECELPQVDCHFLASWLRWWQIEARGISEAFLFEGGWQGGSHIFDWFFSSFHTIFDSGFDDAQCLILKLIFHLVNYLFNTDVSPHMLLSNFLSLFLLELGQSCPDDFNIFILFMVLAIWLDDLHSMHAILISESSQLWE